MDFHCNKLILNSDDEIPVPSWSTLVPKIKSSSCIFFYYNSDGFCIISYHESGLVSSNKLNVLENIKFFMDYFDARDNESLLLNYIIEDIREPILTNVSGNLTRLFWKNNALIVDEIQDMLTNCVMLFNVDSLAKLSFILEKLNYKQIWERNTFTSKEECPNCLYYFLYKGKCKKCDTF